jgi:translation initiation factor IF-3
MFQSLGIQVAVLLITSLQFPSSCVGWSLLSIKRELFTYSRAYVRSDAVTICRSQVSSRTILSMASPQQYNRGSRPSAVPPPINQYIRADRVRLIAPGNDTGDEIMLGIFSLSDALLEADKFQMDLVMINENGDPPVCKIIDYGKYKYSLEKKKKENLKKQVNVDIKEVKMSYKIDQHDFDVRMRAVRKFLGEGDKVSIEMNYDVILCV